MTVLPLEELATLQLQTDGVDLLHPQWTLFHAERVVQICQERMGLSACVECPQRVICDRPKLARRLSIPSPNTGTP